MFSNSSSQVLQTANSSGFQVLLKMLEVFSKFKTGNIERRKIWFFPLLNLFREGCDVTVDLSTGNLLKHTRE